MKINIPIRKIEKLIIIYADWSLHDRKIMESIRTMPESTVMVELHNLDHYKTQAEIDELIGVLSGSTWCGYPTHTPIVGYWKDGILEKAFGYEGRSLIVRVLGLNHERLF